MAELDRDRVVRVMRRELEAADRDIKNLSQQEIDTLLNAVVRGIEEALEQFDKSLQERLEERVRQWRERRRRL